MDNPISKLLITGKQEGPTLSVVGDTYRLLATGAQTNGAFAVIDMLIPPQAGPGPHAHPDFQESFYVVEGEIVVKTKARTYTARQGDFISIPQGGVVHSFKNETTANAHLLCLVVPAGLDAFFEEVGQPVAPDTFLPPPILDAATQLKMQELSRKHGLQDFPPDFLD